MNDFHTTGSIKRRRYRFREPEVMPFSENFDKNLNGSAGSDVQGRLFGISGGVKTKLLSRKGEDKILPREATKLPEGVAFPAGRVAYGQSAGETSRFTCREKSYSPDKEETSRDTKERILLMDDEESVREITGQILTYLGYAVELASTGEEAVALFCRAQSEKKPFSLVMLDLTIRGGMGGFKTLKKLREINPEVRAIIISGYTNDPVVEFFDSHGFNASLTKPFTISQLQTALSHSKESILP